MALPRLAPSTSASAAAGVMKCEYASDMISSTVATLECAAQVSAAAITMHSTGSPVIALQQGAHDRRVLGRRAG